MARIASLSDLMAGDCQRTTKKAKMSTAVIFFCQQLLGRRCCPHLKADLQAKEGLQFVPLLGTSSLHGRPQGALEQPRHCRAGQIQFV